MATSINNQSPTSLAKTLSELESDLASKERQLAREYGKTNIDVDIKTHLQTLTSSLSTTVPSASISDMYNCLQLERKRKRAKENYDLITETKPMLIPSEISNDKSLINSINTLDNACNKLPLLFDNSKLSQMHRANVSIKSSNDAWIYSLDPLQNLVLPKKRDDIQTRCRICNSTVNTNMPPTTDYLLCENHQENLNKFATAVKSIYGGFSQVEPPTERTQFHLNLYGPVLNRWNTFINQLKTKASESKQLDTKNIYEIMIDTNMMLKASIILYERYLNPINMRSFFFIIMSVLDFAAAHQTQIIEGLTAIENISQRVLELCLLLVTRLLVLTRVVVQTFFSFFAIQLNVIYNNVIANMIWTAVSQYWIPVIAAILLGTIAIAVICGVVYLTYKAYQWVTQPPATNAEIDNRDLIVG